MAEVIKMPKLSDTMTEGVVANWLKKVGDEVKEGEILAEIETDKATMEFESFYTGTLLHIGVEKGKAAPVNEILAIIGKKGEDIASLLNGGDSQAAPAAAPATTEIKTEAPSEVTTTAPAAKIEIPEGMNIIEMPKLSDTMTEGVVAKWNKKVGDEVKEGDIIAEIETDKATMEFESFYTGTLLHIGVEAGKSAPVNDILAIIGKKGQDVSAIVANYKTNATTTAASSAPAPAKKEDVKVEQKAASTSTATPTKVAANERVFVSPLAKKLAEERNINLNFVKGTGESGRIVKRDIDNYVPASGGSMRTANMHTSESFTEEPVSQMRKVIAQRLAESKFTAPHFYLTIEMDMDNAIAAREGINNEITPAKVSFNDMVIKAASLALTKHPQVNSSWLGDRIRYNQHVNIGVAVAVPVGLLVPVVRYANTKSLTQIGDEVKTFAKKAKDKKLQPEDWAGNTFTISNLGMFGVEEFTAIINPPDACILAVGGIMQKPVVKNGQIVPGNTMKVTLSCDHRVVDGAVGSAFLQTFKSYIENPITMFV
jgi:pyruvate dehydrogenase E2 component (dihydrolipoamide acetyltransferase)